MDSKVIKLIKVGNFYSCYLDNGIILHYLMGYMYNKDTCKVGFPVSAYNKVINILEDNKLSYEVVEKGEVINKYKGIEASYDDILKKALKKQEMEVRINRLMEKINSYSFEKLEKIVEQMEENEN